MKQTFKKLVESIPDGHLFEWWDEVYNCPVYAVKIRESIYAVIENNNLSLDERGNLPIILNASEFESEHYPDDFIDHGKLTFGVEGLDV